MSRFSILLARTLAQGGSLQLRLLLCCGKLEGCFKTVKGSLPHFAGKASHAADDTYSKQSAAHLRSFHWLSGR